MKLLLSVPSIKATDEYADRMGRVKYILALVLSTGNDKQRETAKLVIRYMDESNETNGLIDV